MKTPKETLEFMLRPKITSLPGHIQSVYVQNIPKLYARIVKEAEDEDDKDLIKDTTQMMLEKLPMFVQSADLEVQERVRVLEIKNLTLLKVQIRKISPKAVCWKCVTLKELGKCFF